MVISTVLQSDSVVHLHILYHFLFHYGLSQYIEYSSLSYTLGPYLLKFYEVLMVAQGT